QRRCLISGVALVERLPPGPVLGVEPLLQCAAFFEQRRIYALTYLGARFRQQVQQPPRAGPLAVFESEPVLTRLRIRLAQLQEHSGARVICALQTGSKGLIPRMRPDSETPLLRNAERSFEKLARLIEISLPPGQSSRLSQHRGFAFGNTDFEDQRQSVIQQ